MKIEHKTRPQKAAHLAICPKPQTFPVNEETTQFVYNSNKTTPCFSKHGLIASIQNYPQKINIDELGNPRCVPDWAETCDIHKFTYFALEVRSPVAVSNKKPLLIPISPSFSKYQLAITQFYEPLLGSAVKHLIESLASY